MQGKLTLSTLGNFNVLFHSLFWIHLKRSAGVKGLRTREYEHWKTEYVIYEIYAGKDSSFVYDSTFSYGEQLKSEGYID